MAFTKPFDGWKAIKPGSSPMPSVLEGHEGMWSKLADRLGHDEAHGVKQLAPVIGGRRRYHHRPLSSWLLSDGNVLTITTDALEAKTWNNLKNKRHPSMPRIYDVTALKLTGENEPKLWAILHERLTWPPDSDWLLFVDTWFRWRAMKHDALKPARPEDLEDFLRFIIDPEQTDAGTMKRQRIEHVMPWQMTKERREEVAFRRKEVWADKGLEAKIAWAKAALKYLRMNKVKFRDFDPSNLAKTKKSGRMVITNLAESRSKPKKTGRLGTVRGST